MSACERTPGCPFFNDKMANMPAMASMMKNNYFASSKEDCARYALASKGKTVPPDMFPNQMDKAKALLAV